MTETKERRTRVGTDSIGGFLDTCKAKTPILLYFDDHGRQRVPSVLGDPPTADELRGNKYLRALSISERVRYQIAGTGESGWCIHLDVPFDIDAYEKGRA